MYFKNIGNDELQHFHNILGADFSMSLTDILSSDLFIKTEVTSGIYKVFPLFYCKEITSSNPNDIILNTQCIILQETSNTYIRFITDTSKNNILFNEDVTTVFNITDNLNTNDFNALVYRLREKGTLTGNINFEENTSITGDYGTYTINLNGEEITNNTGIIINDYVKNNPLTVTLTNPYFLNAKYTLTFTVRTLTGTNVCDDNADDFKSVDTFNIVLIEDTPVALDLTSYVNDAVLDYSINVNVSFDVPEIANNNFTLNLAVDNSTVILDDDITLTATLSGEDNVDGYVVTFFKDGVEVGTSTTENGGVASLTVNQDAVGVFNYTCEVIGLSSVVTVTVNKKTPVLTLNTNSTSVIYGETLTISVNLSYNNIGVGSANVELYDGNTLITTVETDSNGDFTTTYQVTSESVSLLAIFNGNDNYVNVNSSTVIITVDTTVNLTLTVTGTSFTSYIANPFSYNDNVFIDYGDGTVEQYTGQQLNHTYASNDKYNINFYGEITGLNNQCFYYKSNIRTAVLGDNISSMGYSCFEECTGLQTVVLSDNISEMGVNCFYNCNNLVTAVLPSNLTTLSAGTFQLCSNLVNIELPDTLTSLDDFCFYGCSSLIQINIPSGVTSVGSRIFKDATGLTLLGLNWTSSDNIVTYNNGHWGWLENTDITTIQIPTGTTDLYTAKSYPSSKLIERS